MLRTSLLLTLLSSDALPLHPHAPCDELDRSASGSSELISALEARTQAVLRLVRERQQPAGPKEQTLIGKVQDAAEKATGKSATGLARDYVQTKLVNFLGALGFGAMGYAAASFGFERERSDSTGVTGPAPRPHAHDSAKHHKGGMAHEDLLRDQLAAMQEIHAHLAAKRDEELRKREEEADWKMRTVISIGQATAKKVVHLSTDAARDAAFAAGLAYLYSQQQRGESTDFG